MQERRGLRGSVQERHRVTGERTCRWLHSATGAVHLCCRLRCTAVFGCAAGKVMLTCSMWRVVGRRRARMPPACGQVHRVRHAGGRGEPLGASGEDASIAPRLRGWLRVVGRRRARMPPACGQVHRVRHAGGRGEPLGASGEDASIAPRLRGWLREDASIAPRLRGWLGFGRTLGSWLARRVGIDCLPAVRAAVCFGGRRLEVLRSIAPRLRGWLGFGRTLGSWLARRVGIDCLPAVRAAVCFGGRRLEVLRPLGPMILRFETLTGW